MKRSVVYLFSIAAMILTSCVTSPTTQIPGVGSGFEPSIIKEPQIGAPYTEITFQEMRTSNCDGTNPTTTISRSLVQEQTTFFEVAVEAGGLVRGTPIPTVLEAELETKIKAAVGSSLGNKFEQSISTVLETEPGQAWKHKIFWKETKIKGLIDVVYQNGTATLNFEKLVAIELYDRTSESLICDGNNVSIPPTPSKSTPVVTLETALPPTDVAQTTSMGRIVFDSPVNGKWQVFAINPDSSNLEQLTNISEGIGDPAISPNGALIVFVGDASKKLYVMKADGTNINSVYEVNTETGWPSWSFDSRQIVFASQVNGHKNLFTMNYDGTQVVQITDTVADDLAPAFSPDGKQIIFSSNRSGNWEIYKLTIGSNAIDKLTNQGNSDVQGWPSWSPDGSKITFECPGNANKSDVCIMNPDGSELKNLTNNPEYDGAPVWSPDGKYIAFASDRDGGLDIYLIQNDGGEVQRLTSIWAWGPSWSQY